MTVTPGGREYETFIKEIRELRKHSSSRETKPADYLARRTAILFNHENSWSIERQKQNRTWDTFAHIEKYYRTLKSFGAPVDFISEAKNLSDYPVVIAPTYQLADKELVDKWITYVKNGGNLILTCRTAQKDRYGRLPEAPFGSMITPLTGNEMNFYDLLLPENPGTVVMDGKEYIWNTWGEILNPPADAQVWATYKNEFYEGSPAVTFRKLGKGTITYVGVDALPPDWTKGSVKGLKARGGYEISIDWKDGKVTHTTIKSPKDDEVDILINGQLHHLVLKAGITTQL